MSWIYLTLRKPDAVFSLAYKSFQGEHLSVVTMFVEENIHFKTRELEQIKPEKHT